MASTRKKTPPASTLHQLLRYNPDTGAFYWRRRTEHNCSRPEWFNNRYAGKPAFTATTKKGYKYGLINGVSYRAHRIAWVMVYGEDPGDLLIDHINRDASDNRICNIRLATASSNQRNKGPNATGTSRYKGVSHANRKDRWQAYIRLNGKKRHLGTFRCETAAALRYDAVAKEMGGEFMLTNMGMSHAN